MQHIIRRILLTGFATALFLVMGSPTAAAGQAASVCDVFAAPDVEGMIGPVKQKSPMGSDMCTWTSEHSSLMVTRDTADTAEQAQQIVQAASQNSQDRVIREETGLGDRALSATAQKEAGVTVIFSKGTSVWTLVLSHDSADTFNGAEMLPKVKAVAQKAALAR